MKAIKFFVFFLFINAQNFVFGAVDTVYADSIAKQIIRMAFKNPDKALEVSEELFQYSTENDYLEGLSNAYCGKCMIAALKGKIDSALILCDSAKTIAFRSSSSFHIAKSSSFMANVQRRVGQTEEAFINYNISLKFYEQTKDYKGLVGTHHNLGVLYDQLGRRSLAIDHLNKAVSFKDSVADQQLLANAYTSIAAIYTDLEQYSKSLKYYEMALTTYQQGKPNRRLGHINLNMARTMEDSGLYIQSYQKYHTAMKIFLITNFENRFKEAHLDFCEWFLKVGNLDQNLKTKIADSLFIPTTSLLDSALFYGKSYYDYFKNSTDKGKTVRAFNLMGQVHLELNEYVQSIKHFKKSLSISENYNYPNQKITSLRGLVQCYSALKKPVETAKYSEELYGFSKQLFQKQLTEINERVELSYSIENQLRKSKEEALVKNNQIERLQQEGKIKNRNIIILLSGLVLLILISILFVLITRQKRMIMNREKELLEIKHTQLEQKVLRTQMNPHFISNSLTAIQAFILKNQSIQSASYLAKFAKLMRLIIESSRMDLIKLEEELQILEYYLDLQKLRFDNKLDFSISIDDALDPEEIRLPPMLLQPFIENAVEHGINKSEGKIDIQFNSSAKEILISIEDNGIGIASSRAVDKKDRKSYSTQITKERIE
ncbi:MAG: tetratricopeptide repeat protein, partial [Flavobacteriales bacterium]|nr:tetratricopeptide repeat protein [Flavobacteriales bacterium]